MKNIQQILSSQREFYNSQCTKDPSFRKEQLKKLYDIVKLHEKDILDALAKDFGKPQFEGYATEVGFVLSEIRFHLKNVIKWSAPRGRRGNLLDFFSTAKIYSEPMGQVLIIAPWNYPFQLLMSPLIGAISAGNTAIVKPSELAPSTSSIIFSLISENFDKDYIYCFEGGKEETNELLKLNFDFIFFTGSEKVGRIVMQAAANNLCPVCLELGGKSPCIIDKTAPIDLTCKRIAWGKFLNAGQTCVAPDYILVHRDISAAIKYGIKKYIKEFYGKDPSDSKDFARIINLHHFNRISNLLDEKKIFYGGNTNESDLYISPTILENITFSDRIMQEEIFGPVLPIIEFTEPEEIIENVKKFAKPLSFYVFSKSKSFQKKMIQEIEAGNANINDTVMQFANKNLPFGGKGNSGTGSYHGRQSFETFSHLKSVNHKSFLIDLPIRYPPYSSIKLNLIRKLLK